MTKWLMEQSKANPFKSRRGLASHKNYSNRTKSLEVIEDNAYRNLTDYAYEGWQRENVVEDDVMYIDANTGERAGTS